MALDAPLTIERIEGKTPGTLIYRLIGPLTLRNLFDLQSQLRSADPPPVTIIDLTEVPYMDSTGMGMIVNHHVRCKSKGTKLIVSGVNSRVFELFKLTKVDTVIPMTSTVEEAEAGA
jgi:anti-anti-sigma factor